MTWLDLVALLVILICVIAKYTIIAVIAARHINDR